MVGSPELIFVVMYRCVELHPGNIGVAAALHGFLNVSTGHFVYSRAHADHRNRLPVSGLDLVDKGLVFLAEMSQGRSLAAGKVIGAQIDYDDVRLSCGLMVPRRTIFLSVEGT